MGLQVALVVVVLVLQVGARLVEVIRREVERHRGLPLVSRDVAHARIDGRVPFGDPKVEPVVLALDVLDLGLEAVDLLLVLSLLAAVHDVLPRKSDHLRL